MNQSVVIAVRISTPVADRLLRLAEKDDRSISYVVREILLNAVSPKLATRLKKKRHK